MVKDVTAAVAKNIGCPTSAVNIDIVEMKPDNFAMDAKLWCDTH